MFILKNGYFYYLFTLVLCSYSQLVIAANEQHSVSQLSVEELRIEKARKDIPKITSRFDKQLIEFNKQLTQYQQYNELQTFVIKQAQQLWLNALKNFAKQADFDDRPLYWARLQMSEILKQSRAFSSLSNKEKKHILWQFELNSRGKNDINFDKESTVKVLLTGFDPFFLDRHIDQSNPSGVVALSLDNKKIIINGQQVEIETLLIPVRFADFDQGIIEELLTPYIKSKSVDMVFTVSMGRTDFDLERFPALRRSAKAPDNLNVYTGATAKKPLKPLLYQQALAGPEFVEFSLPVSEMVKVKGKYKVNDNRYVSTLKQRHFAAKSLTQLAGEISVSGSGGGYLSNEISYRSILLRNKYNKHLPVGHIHTPRIVSFKQNEIKTIVQQTQAIVERAIAAL